MRPVMQQFKHDPAAGIEGDCLRACVASILDCPIDGVPHVAHFGDAWYGGLYGFLWGIGYDLDHIGPAEYDGTSIVIASGQSPRFAGSLHAVVWQGKAVIHDPHPDQGGLEGAPTGFYTLEKRVTEEASDERI